MKIGNVKINVFFFVLRDDKTIKIFMYQDIPKDLAMKM